MQTAAPALDLLTGARRQVVEHLKRRGPASASTVAEGVDLSVSGARQILSALEGDGLVTHRRQRKGPGRPRHLYELTDRGDRLFPRRHAELARELLAYVEDADADLLEEIFRRRRSRRLDEARSRLEGRSFAGRVREMARILDEDGYLAEAREQDDGSFLIVEHNCAVRCVAERYGQACSSEIGFLRDALPEAEIERITHIASGGSACTYRIRHTSPEKKEE